MEAISDTMTSPIYRGEFRDLDYSRLIPTSPRYQPRETPSIGMFDTSRANLPNRATMPSAATKTQEQIAQAAENRRKASLTKPYSIALRALAAMRERGEDWTRTAELVDLANAHMPEHCVPATKQNLYMALAPYRKRGVVESRPIAGGSQYLEWRIAQ